MWVLIQYFLSGVLQEGSVQPVDSVDSDGDSSRHRLPVQSRRARPADAGFHDGRHLHVPKDWHHRRITHASAQVLRLQVSNVRASSFQKIPQPVPHQEGWFHGKLHTFALTLSILATRPPNYWTTSTNLLKLRHGLSRPNPTQKLPLPSMVFLCH